MKRTIHVVVCALLVASTAAAQAPTAPTPAAAPAASAPSAPAPVAAAPPAVPVTAGAEATPVTPGTPAAPGTPTASVEANDAVVTPSGSAPAATGVAAGGQGYTYRPEGRRDPFLPLLKNSGKSTAATTVAARAAGLAGLGVAEVSLRGVLMSQGGYVGMLQGTDDKTYIVRTGDRLADGTIRAITSQMLLIHQEIKDPLSRQKEREVRKMLRQQPDGTN